MEQVEAREPHVPADVEETGDALLSDAEDSPIDFAPEQSSEPDDKPDGLPDLKLVDSDNTENSEKRELEKPESAERKEELQEWTVAVNLNFGNRNETEYTERLEQFAEKTKGKPVTVLAQAVIPNENADNGARVERYLLKDGKYEKLEEGESRGFTADLSDLLQTAARNYPAKKIGLIHGSHGLGNPGFKGTGKQVSTKEFVDAIEKGLEGSGHKKLEMLDMLSCLTAQNGVLENFQEVTKNLIASEKETSSIGFGDVNEGIKPVLDDPAATGEEIAEDIMGGEIRQTTLGAFNLEEYGDFRKSLDRFGSSLSEAISDPQSLKKIQSIVEEMEQERLIEHLQKFDLKRFAGKVLEAAESGELPDESGKLKESARAMLDAKQDMMLGYHGHGTGEKLGGLSVFLPHWLPEEKEKDAVGATGLGSLSSFIAEANPEHVLRELTKPELRKLEGPAGSLSAGSSNDEPPLKFYLSEMWDMTSGLEKTPGLSSEDTEMIKQLKEAVKALPEIDTKSPEALESVKKVLGDMSSICKQLEKRPWYARQLETAREAVHKRVAREYQGEMIGKPGGWRKFREKLFRATAA